MFSAAFHEGNKAEPHYTASFEPKLNEAPWAPQDAARKRAAGQEEARQKRGTVRAPFLNAGELALRCRRYIIAGKVAGAWGKLGGVGEELMHLAH